MCLAREYNGIFERQPAYMTKVVSTCISKSIPILNPFIPSAYFFPYKLGEHICLFKGCLV